MSVAFALFAALLYGSADFLGGMASRKTNVFGVAVIIQGTGLPVLLVALLWIGGPMTGADMLWSTAGGIAVAVGSLVFYRALARGVMSVVAPATALTTAAVPVIFGVATGERIGLWGTVGVVLVVVAVALVSMDSGLGSLKHSDAVSVLPAVLSGVAFGSYFVALAQTSHDAGLTPLVVVRTAAVAVVLGAARLGHVRVRPARGALRLAVAAGVTDTLGNVVFLIATRLPGPLAVTAVIASLYPATTVLLAQVLLRERIVRVQLAGLALACVAIVLIAYATLMA